MKKKIIILIIIILLIIVYYWFSDWQYKTPKQTAEFGILYIEHFLNDYKTLTKEEIKQKYGYNLEYYVEIDRNYTNYDITLIDWEGGERIDSIWVIKMYYVVELFYEKHTQKYKFDIYIFTSTIYKNATIEESIKTDDWTIYWDIINNV